MLRGNRALIVIVVGLAATYFVVRHWSRKPLKLSDNPPAPNFSVADLNGRPLTLSAYRGEVVLLNFWATWCEPCRKEIPRFIEFQNRYGNSGLQVVGISLDDDINPVRKFR